MKIPSNRNYLLDYNDTSLGTVVLMDSGGREPVVSRHLQRTNMVVSYVVKEMDFSFWEEEGCRNGMDWSVAPALWISKIQEEECLVEETTCMV